MTINRPFNEIEVETYFAQITDRIKKEILSNSKDYIIGVDRTEYIDYLVAKYTIDELAIDFESEQVTLCGETEKEYRDGGWHRGVYKYTEYRFCVKFQYSGSTDILRIKPSCFKWSIGGSGDVSTIDINGNTLMVFFTIYKRDKSEYNSAKNGTIAKTFDNLDGALFHIRAFNKRLRQQIEREFDRVKSKYLQDLSFYQELNIKTNDEHKTFTVPVIKKRITPPSLQETSKPTPALEEVMYRNILRTIYSTYKGFERLPSLYRDKDEEALRDGVLPTLQTSFKNVSTSGETFNKEGKTDICIKEPGGGNVFIAECKIWKGEKYLLSAISQLLDRYVTWRDTKTALIVFVKNDGFADIVKKANAAIKKHEYYVRSRGATEDTSFSYVFCLPNDQDREIFLELMMFHFI